MKRLALASGVMVVAASSLGWVACSSGGNGAGPAAHSDAGVAEAGGDANPGVDAGLQPAIPCTDSIASIYGDPGPNFASLKAGSIIYCAHDTDIPVAALQTLLNNDVSQDTPIAPGAPVTNTGYIGKPLTSGVHIYRILYRTERGDTANSPGYSSAQVLIPDTPRASDLPILVASHGSRGQAAACTASLEDDAGPTPDVLGDYLALGLPLAGLGYVVILPDLAGYSNFGAAGNPPSAYADALDVGKSTLDGARALTNMLSTGLGNQVVLVGHSQGGSSSLGAVGIASSYAPELQIVAAALYSPLWFSQASWGALLYSTESSEFSIAADPGITAVSVWYHYTRAALLDGPDAALALFAPAKAAQVASFVNNDCWGRWGPLEEAGTVATDLFSTAFANSVGTAAALGLPCDTGDTTCQTWIDRYAADRPTVPQSFPVLIEYGGQDEVIPPPRMACVIQRLGPPTQVYPQGNGVDMTFCLDGPYGHKGIVRAHASDVADWIAWKVLGGAQPPPCEYNQNNLRLDDAGLVDPADDGGVLQACETPPPN